MVPWLGLQLCDCGISRSCSLTFGASLTKLSVSVHEMLSVTNYEDAKTEMSPFPSLFNVSTL